VEVLRQKELPVGCIFGQVTSPGLGTAIFERAKEAHNDDGGRPKSDTHLFPSCDFGRARGRWRLMSFPIVSETGDTGLVSAARVGDCLRFFNLDAFGLAPIDRRLLLHQV
jgi:hypothetical protein